MNVPSTEEMKEEKPGKGKEERAFARRHEMVRPSTYYLISGHSAKVTGGDALQGKRQNSVHFP